MTGLLEEALRRVEALSQPEQDAIASQILESLKDEAEWETRFQKVPERLKALADEADDRPTSEYNLPNCGDISLSTPSTGGRILRNGWSAGTCCSGEK